MNTDTLPCLTIRQPWANCIFDIEPRLYLGGGSEPKDIENRSWATDYRGPLLIHAAKAFDPEPTERYFRNKRSEFQRGVILGLVQLAGIYDPYERSPWAIPGQRHWHLVDPVRFVVPIPYVGRQGLFRVPISDLKGQYDV